MSKSDQNESNFQPIAHTVDPEGNRAVYAQAMQQDAFLNFSDYDPVIKPVDWLATVCLDDQFRVHWGAWPHAYSLPSQLKGNSIIFESDKPEWIEYCKRVLKFRVPDHLQEHKNIKILEK